MRAVYGALLWRKRRLSGLYIQVLPAVRHQRLPLDPAAGFFSPAFHPVPAALGLGLGSHAPAQRGAANHRGRIHSTIVPAGADESENTSTEDSGQTVAPDASTLDKEENPDEKEDSSDPIQPEADFE